MAASSSHEPEPATIRTPESLSNFAYLLSLLQQVEAGDTGKRMVKYLTEVTGRFGQSPEVVDKLLSDAVFRQKMMSTMKNNLDAWLSRNADKLDSQTIELLTPSKVSELVRSYYDENDRKSHYSTPNYNDVQSIRFAEEYYGLPVTGQFEEILHNYEEKYNKKFDPYYISTAAGALLGKAILKKDLVQIRRLISKGVDPSPLKISLKTSIRKHGATPSIIAMLDELLKTRLPGGKRKLALRLAEIAAALDSNELFDYAMSHGVETRDLVKAAVLANKIPLLEQAIDAGGDPNDGLDAATKRGNTAMLIVLLNQGADPVEALIKSRERPRNISDGITMNILRRIDPDFVPSAAFVDALHNVNTFDPKLLDFTDSLVFQEPFPEKIIGALVNDGLRININEAIKMKNGDYIKRILDTFGVDAIDIVRAIFHSSKNFPEILPVLIPLIPALEKRNQGVVLRAVRKTHDKALIDLLLQNPHNDFATNFPKSLAQMQKDTNV